MPFNLLILPLLGGFIFVNKFNPTSFDIARHSGQRLIFYSATAGVCLLAFVKVLFLIIDFIAPNDWICCLEYYWVEFMPWEYSGIAVAAFITGAFGWYPLNKMFPIDGVVRKTIETDKANALEKVFYYASEPPEQYVQITCANSKVYVGIIKRTPPNPASTDAYIQILPVYSGYRDSVTHRVEFTTFYDDVYSKLAEDKLDEDDINMQSKYDEFLKVIPISSIESAGLFDPGSYELFNTEKDENG